MRFLRRIEQKEPLITREDQDSGDLNKKVWDFEATKINEIKDQELKEYLEYINKYSGFKIDILEDDSDGAMVGMDMYKEGNDADLPASFEGKVPKERLMQFLRHLYVLDYDEVGLRGITMSDMASSAWRTFIAERNGEYDKLINDVASRLHEKWRAPRKLKESDGYDPRWKDPEDDNFVKQWQEKLKPREGAGNVRMIEDGKIEIDIANSSYPELTKYWQKENESSAAVSVFEIMRMLNSSREIGEEPERILPQSLDVSSEAVHREWLRRNPWGEDDAIIRLPFHIMKMVGKKDVSKLDVEDFLVRISDKIKETEEGKGKKLSSKEIDQMIVAEAPKYASEELKKDRDVTSETIKEMKEEQIISDETIR